eukprot:6564183-Pyramimonas_sp.AAC.1
MHGTTSPAIPAWAFCVIASDAQGEWFLGFQAGCPPETARILPQELLSAHAEFEATIWAAK